MSREWGYLPAHITIHFILCSNLQYLNRGRQLFTFSNPLKNNIIIVWPETALLSVRNNNLAWFALTVFIIDCFNVFFLEEEKSLSTLLLIHTHQFFVVFFLVSEDIVGVTISYLSMFYKLQTVL